MDDASCIKKVTHYSLIKEKLFRRRQDENTMDEVTTFMPPSPEHEVSLIKSQPV